jgi:SAM-dependent methyltransferase
MKEKVRSEKSMKEIDCHNLYRDGRHYDLHNIDFVEDIDFYLKQIERYGEPVLELACGTGRITIPIAQREIQISGIDISDSMLEHAKQKAKEKGLDIEWLRADFRSFSIEKKYNLIFIPFNSIVHIHDREGFEGLFRCVKEHLSEQGRFIIDVFNPRLDILMRDTSDVYPVKEYPDPDGRGTVVVTERHNYDAASQINRIKWYYNIGNGEEEFVVENNIRILFPQELDDLLYYNNIIIETKYGNYDESEFNASSPKQIVICRKK